MGGYGANGARWDPRAHMSDVVFSFTHRRTHLRGILRHFLFESGGMWGDMGEYGGIWGIWGIWGDMEPMERAARGSHMGPRVPARSIGSISPHIPPYPTTSHHIPPHPRTRLNIISAQSIHNYTLNERIPALRKPTTITPTHCKRLTMRANKCSALPK